MIKSDTASEKGTTKNNGIYILVICLLCSLATDGQTRKKIETSTDILMFITPVSGFVSSLVIGDYQGTKQIVLSGATNLAASFLLKYTIKKERPDHSNYHSFPSAHTSIAFQGASFIQRRYGWKWGAPAYLLSAYVGWGRTYAKKHDWWDVVGGAAIGTASTYIFTRPFARKHNLTLSPSIINGQHPGFYASMAF